MSVLLYAMTAVNYAMKVWETAQDYYQRVYNALQSDSRSYLFPTDSVYVVPVTKCVNPPPTGLYFHVDTLTFSGMCETKTPSILSLELKVGNTEYDLTTFFERVRYSWDSEPSIQQYISAWAVSQGKYVVFDGTVHVDVIMSNGEMNELDL